MNPISQYLVNEILKDNTTLIYGGGFKFPTRGHLEVVKQSLEQYPQFNKYIIFVGSGERDGITQQQSVNIWNIYKKYFPFNIEIIPVPSPVKAVFDYSKENPQENIIWVIGGRQDNEDDMKDFINRTKTVEKYPNITASQVITPLFNISGTKARQALKTGDKSEVISYLPPNISDEDIEQIIDILMSPQQLNEIKEFDRIEYYTSFVSNVVPSDFNVFRDGDKIIVDNITNLPLFSIPESMSDPKKGTGKKPKGSGRRLYTDEDPSDTVSIKFSSKQDIIDTLSKSSFKSKSHKRQSQIINVIHQRVRAAYQRAKDPKVKARLKTALDYAEQRKEASKEKTQRLKKENVAPNHTGKSAPYGSGYKELNENASYSKDIDYKSYIKELTNYMIEDGWNILPLPKIIFKHGDKENAKNFLGKTAYYDPNTQTIVLYTEGRHPKDILRSFSHEMVHHIQNLEDRLGDVSTTNTMEDDNINKLEQEANLKGTMTFRNWTDSLNENIAPLKSHKVYHSTDSKFEDFSLDYAWDGFWFTDDLDSLKNRTAGASGGKYILTRYITLKNPAGWDEYDKYSIGELIDMGYDGVILPDPGRTDYIVFNPKSISKNIDSLNESLYLDIPKFNQPKTIQQYLVENINEISLSKENAADINGDLTGGTFTVGDITYEYSIKNISNPYKDLGTFYNIQFTPRGEVTSTPKGGKENYIKILSTMYKIIVDFIEKEKPTYIGISSLDNTGDKNYHTVYNRLTDNNLKLIPGYFRKDSNLQFDSPQGKGRFIVLQRKNNTNESKSKEYLKEYKQYVLNELFEKDLPIIDKVSKNLYIVSNGDDIEAKYDIRLEIPERDLWSMNWFFTPDNKNKSPEAWKQVTATSFKVLEDWLKTNNPKAIYISGNTGAKTKLYKMYIDKLQTLLNNRYKIDNSDEDRIVLHSIEEVYQSGIKKRMETLNESYEQALSYWQNGDINSKSKIERWNSIKKKIERQVIQEIYQTKKPNISKSSKKDPFGINQYARELAQGLEEQKQDYIIYCDIDGVIADFDARFRELAKMSPDQYEEKYGIEKFWNFIDNEIGVRFWVGIPWMQDGKQLWEYIKKYKPTLLSAPSRNNESRLGKRLWVKKHIPGTKLVLASRVNKQDYAKPNAILIDDRPDTIVEWENKGGVGILHKSAEETIQKLKSLDL
jgi:hypothetical protein